MSWDHVPRSLMDIILRAMYCQTVKDGRLGIDHETYVVVTIEKHQ